MSTLENMILSETGKKKGKRKEKGNSHWAQWFWESRLFPSGTNAETCDYEETRIRCNSLFLIHVCGYCISYSNEILRKIEFFISLFQILWPPPVPAPSESALWTKQGSTRNTRASSSDHRAQGCQHSPVPCAMHEAPWGWLWFCRWWAPSPASVDHWALLPHRPWGREWDRGGYPHRRVLV